MDMMAHAGAVGGANPDYHEFDAVAAGLGVGAKDGSAGQCKAQCVSPCRALSALVGPILLPPAPVFSRLFPPALVHHCSHTLIWSASGGCDHLRR